MTFDLNKDYNKKVHFIGIGGISMSGLAEILLKHGYKVSGSDMKSSNITERLKEKGATIYIGHNAENVLSADIVVYTAAISPDNPEFIKAKELKLTMMDRAEFLGLIMKGHKYNVTVSGTHGKTTTTSMISHILLDADVDPTILVGGELNLIGGNVRTGDSEYFIAEACEYKASFLKFYPYIGIILNIEADHLDYYKDINHIKETFQKFVSLIPRDGYLIGNAEDEHVYDIMNKTNTCNIISYGFNKGTLQAHNIEFDNRACASFDVTYKDTFLFRATLSVPGKHNVLNALSCIAASLTLKVEHEHILKGLSSFKGAHKRFEIKGIKNGITVIDDYAHHPTEIKATLSTAKNIPHKRIFCVFQPHTYTRTISLLDEFSESFYDADEIILADIYAAREKDTGIISSNTLGDKIRSKGLKCTNLHSFEDIKNYLKKNTKDGDLVLTIGAGDIVKVGEAFLRE
ncbi:MAG: UDP-N-acetylmuramate--L-alanine ligase [Clostridiales bacterium]|uniref:UDP-N-acetylmuramate--L-alanine ligase n=1 Tax=Clostridium sp. N3C TaxID=1776758 RepID=UPI00092DFA7B|nr:UDP-N-acetylmuramate--L-alanine ligase [Clostridium sp. N3C]NLZ48360.1 UDP-N-acetylmuramate--L-alanine ligase [Clostridiales bacterium]SCN23101.1 UDP-N-acetylmuramate-L-alanine ligase [Clostridium sp. N3C]